MSGWYGIDNKESEMVPSAIRKAFVVLIAAFSAVLGMNIILVAPAQAGETKSSSYKWVHQGGPISVCEGAVLNDDPFVIEVTAASGDIDPQDLKLYLSFDSGADVAAEKVDPGRFVATKQLSSLPVSFSGLRATADAGLSGVVTQGVDCPVGTPDVEFRGTECADGATSIIVYMSNPENGVDEGIEIRGQKGQDIGYVFGVLPGEERTEYIPFTGTVTVGAYINNKLVAGLTTFSDEGCTPPPDYNPSAVIGDVVCTSSGAHAVVSLGNPEPTFAEIGFEVSASNGFLKSVTVKPGKTSKVSVPLVEDKAVTVMVVVLDAEKPFKVKTLTANCEGIIPPVTEESLPETGAAEIVAKYGPLGLGLVLLGIALVRLGRKPKSAIVA